MAKDIGYPWAGVPLKPLTGEKFFMRDPGRGGKKAEYEYFMYCWEKLRTTIERCGGTVESLPRQWHDFLYASIYTRSPMYVRDPALILHLPDQPLMVGTTADMQSRSEIKALKRALEKQGPFKEAYLSGDTEGGNLVYDPSRNILFWGVNNHRALEHIATGVGFGPDPLWHTKEQAKTRRKQHIIRQAKPHASALREGFDLLDHHPQLGTEEKPLRVVPLFMPDNASLCGEDINKSFYHLDGAFGMLPTGEAVVCRQLLSATANRALDKLIGASHIIAISREDAERGATNFITVGSAIITPFASEAMKSKFTALGYRVIDPPSAGLPENAWNFGAMASVRCATLKVTPDAGFPPQQQQVRASMMAAE